MRDVVIFGRRRARLSFFRGGRRPLVRHVARKGGPGGVSGFYLHVGGPLILPLRLHGAILWGPSRKCQSDPELCATAPAVILLRGAVQPRACLAAGRIIQANACTLKKKQRVLWRRILMRRRRRRDTDESLLLFLTFAACACPISTLTIRAILHPSAAARRLGW